MRRRFGLVSCKTFPKQTLTSRKRMFKEEVIKLNDSDLEGEFEVQRKSPFFKTLTGVAFVLGVGVSLSAKLGGLTSIPWPILIFGTIGMGLFLRYVVYRYSPFNVEKLETTDNLDKAIELKNMFDLRANRREEKAKSLDRTLKSILGPTDSPLDALIAALVAYKVILYDMNPLGLNKCDIYDVERNEYVKYKFSV